MTTVSRRGNENLVTTVSEFVRQVREIRTAEAQKEHKEDFIFRGQPCDKPLLPKLGRCEVRGELADVERLLLQEFARTSWPFREFTLENEWDLVALAQHHGLPTRLLDWTYGALTALWFAVREATEENGVVWMLSTRVDDFHEQAANPSGPLDNASRTLIFRPKAISRRIVAQNGIFTVHKLIENTRFVAFEKNRAYKDRLTKFVVSPNHFHSLRNELHVLNTNAASIFPDLDGLCLHLKWRYTKMLD